jgi:hypothetical protein
MCICPSTAPKRRGIVRSETGYTSFSLLGAVLGHDSMLQEPDILSEEEDYDNQVQHFDYLSIHAVVVSPTIKHPAFGLPYSEYRKKRSRITDTDADVKNSKITFYCDKVIGGLLPSLARRRNLSLYAYINDMLEEGQIHFHPEHHDTYNRINEILDDMQIRTTNDTQSHASDKLRNQKISFGTCARGNPMFVPRIAYWLAEDIKTVSIDLHMTLSDTAYLYIITGILYTDLPEMPLNKYYDRKLSSVLIFFDKEIDAMLDICEHIASGFDNLTD